MFRRSTPEKTNFAELLKNSSIVVRWTCERRANGEVPVKSIYTFTGAGNFGLQYRWYIYQRYKPEQIY